ncbi:MAG: NAD(P)H-dependent oxidoreductase, partial [Comamonadaceae bacterium]
MDSTASPAIRLVAISGSLRRESHCTAVLRSLQPLLPASATVELLPLDAVPLYNADLDGESAPEAVRHFKRAIAEADGIVICSP